VSSSFQCKYIIGSVWYIIIIIPVSKIFAANSNASSIRYPELGMEAVWKIDVKDFPAFIVVDDKGNDFFKKWLG
jgi:tartrate dehydratase beta subunit/fumarate hydratase class I family protein